MFQTGSVWGFKLQFMAFFKSWKCVDIKMTCALQYFSPELNNPSVTDFKMKKIEISFLNM